MKTINKSYDLVIRRGTVFDGRGGPGKVLDIGIRDSRIAHLGNLKRVPSQSDVKSIAGDIQVALVPVGGGSGLNSSQAVEVIRGVSTSDETAQAGKAFVLRIGKEAIMVNRDVAGFVINRINYPSTMEAMRLVEQGVATVEDIDKGLRLASGRKMGIFEIGDMVGLEVTHSAMMAMYEETGDPRWYPPLLLRRKVKAGHLGRKTGKGWYEYNPDGTRRE